MRLLKPHWVSHDERALFCIDIHPNGSRFATGGQGQDRTGTITVWNMRPVLSESAELDCSVNRRLCHMDNHQGCVNCLRWSYDGRRLASGGDDKLVMIWQHSIATGSGEVWRCAATLRGHGGDVFDLAWAPRDLYLATGSIDNQVIVWNTGKWGEMIARLEGHTGLVKGVCWDPVGKYLCSQADDRSLRVWRTCDWREEAAVTRPFSDTAGTTAVLRCHWSPDGRYIVSAHSVNNGGPTAAIIDRGRWSSDKDFVGHRKAVTCVRFSPALLKMARAGSAKHSAGVRSRDIHCACAIGSRDRGLSVWLTCLKRPLVVIHELFDDSVTDLSWWPSSGWLAACSKDGTVAFIGFSDRELGVCVSDADCASLHEKLYGRSVLSAKTAIPQRSAQLIESPQLLKQLEQASTQLPGELSKSAVPVAVKRVCSGPSSQSETRTVDGRRRITPMFIPLLDIAADTSVPFGCTSTGKQTDLCSVSDAAECSSDDVKKDTTLPAAHINNKPVSAHVAARIEPIDQNKSQSTTTATPSTVSTTTTTATTTTITSTAVSAVDAVQLGEVCDTAAAAEETPIYGQVKRRPDRPHPGRPPGKRGRPPLPRRPVLSSSPPAAAVTAPDTPAPSAITTTATSVKFVPSMPAYVVAPPALQRRLSMSIEGSTAGATCLLEIDNRADGGVCLIECSSIDRKTREKQLMWSSCVCCRVLACRHSCDKLLLACQDHTLHVLSSCSGRRLLPPLQLPGQPARLAVRGPHVLVVTSCARVSTWNLHVPSAGVCRAESIAHLLSVSASGGAATGGVSSGGRQHLVGCSLTVEGEPVLLTADGRAHIFSSKMCCWMLIADAACAGSELSGVDISSLPISLTPSTGCGSGTPLATIMTQAKRAFPTRVSTLRQAANAKNASLMDTATVAFLDSQVSSALFLGSSSEYRLWMCALVRQLVLNGDQLRLREICQDLLGPTHSTANLSSDWPATVVGVDKRALLRQLLPLMSSNLSLQRLMSEIQDQLDCSDTFSTC